MESELPALVDFVTSSWMEQRAGSEMLVTWVERHTHELRAVQLSDAAVARARCSRDV